ncbi:MAG: GDSL-type esterase/lipase family protein [Myxococcota bacterium]
MKRAMFALAPLLLLVALAEAGLRLAGAGGEPIAPFTLPGESAGLLELDRDLFWRLRANARGELQGAPVATNSLGQRDDELEAKLPDELRILSLGESTTFGNGVRVEDTYSQRLERTLRAALAPRHVVVVNAGTPAWSSFQSLEYLRGDGIALAPDWVLFYHEGNDRLPAYVRASDSTLLGMAQSDVQLHADRFRRFHRWLLDVSAIYRFAQYRAALARIERFQSADEGGAAARDASARWRAEVAGAPVDLRFPVRVPPDERRAVLEELAALAQQRGFRLLLVHPAYRDSRAHECVLTELARERGIALVDAMPILHPDGAAPGALFLDAMHPNAEGHRRLARALGDAILAELRRGGR